MASLRRSRVLSPEGQTAKFLYTIIKQLDLKAIDWNEVASGLDITNGHAARMRYSRFKAQIEGLPTQSKPRAPRPKKDNAGVKGKGKNKPGYEPGKVDDMKFEDDGGNMKIEQDEPTIKAEPGVMIKQEHTCLDEHMTSEPTITETQVKPEPGLTEQFDLMQTSLSTTITPPQGFETLHDTTMETASPGTIKLETFPHLQQSLSPIDDFASMNIHSCPTPPATPIANTVGFSPGPPYADIPPFSMSGPSPYMDFPPAPSASMLPPHGTVSLAQLQLPPISRLSNQLPLPEFSYPFAPMGYEFDFDFNAPIPPQPYQMQTPWQPQFDMLQPVNVNREREE